MDTLPIELVDLIVEYSCCCDVGQTARSLGLVSKTFRTLAEPMELRSIAVSGFEHLQAVFSKVERSRSESRGRYKRRRRGRNYDTKHLFICEISKEHALAVDTRGDKTIGSGSSKLKRTYRSQTFDFWVLADKLIRDVSGTLECLSLVAWETWLMSTPGANQNPESPQVLVALSGASFPNLVSLTVIHNAASGVNCFGGSQYPFIHPWTPALRKLHIATPVYLGANPILSLFRVGHPLLKGMRYTKPNLTHLILCYDWLPEEELAMTALFGPEWPVVRISRRLPGRLQSIVIRHGLMPRPSDPDIYHQLAENFVENVRKHGIDGLEAHLPEPRFPKIGKRRYEVLLSEWEHNALSFDLERGNGVCLTTCLGIRN